MKPGAQMPDRSTVEAQTLIGDESALLSIHIAFKVPARSMMEILCDFNNTAVRVLGRVNSGNPASDVLRLHAQAFIKPCNS
jgi:hypothetical protein